MNSRIVRCAGCGAEAPALDDDARSFTCAFCGAQSFVEHRAREGSASPAAPVDRPVPPPPQAEPLAPPRPRRASGPGLFLIAPLVLVVLAGITLHRISRGPAAELEDCKVFSGEEGRARWSSCPSGATREIACHAAFPDLPPGAMPAGFDGLRCDCLVDGRKAWSFEANTRPPLGPRADAERIAEVSCRMW